MKGAKYDKVLKSFGDKALNLRKKADLSQEEVASVLSVSRITIANIETGRSNTSVEKILMLCALYKCTPNDLLPPVPDIGELKPIMQKKTTVQRRGYKAKFTWKN